MDEQILELGGEMHPVDEAARYFPEETRPVDERMAELGGEMHPVDEQLGIF